VREQEEERDRLPVLRQRGERGREGEGERRREKER
jgi:hypothetical protein